MEISMKFEQIPGTDKFKYDDATYTKDCIIDRIADGYKVEIIDENGFNITKEFLYNHCFPNEAMLQYYITETFSIEDYEEIIENGGTKNVILRAIRNRRK